MLALSVAAFLMVQTPPGGLVPQTPDCAALRPGQMAVSGTLELCAADEALRRAALVPMDARLDQWRIAASAYERAYELLQRTPERLHALEMLFRLHDDSHLKDPAAAERALRLMAGLDPATPAPLVRLARFQEEQRQFDAAEQTLLSARPQFTQSSELLGELSRYFARRVLALALEGARGAEPATPSTEDPTEGWKPACRQALPDAPGSAAAEICRAEAEVQRAAALTSAAAAGRGAGVRDAAAAKQAAAERTRVLQSAAQHYRRATSGLRDDARRIYAYEALARIYGPAYLDEPRASEAALRALVSLRPDASDPVIRLARAQEDMQQIDLAESTLFGARQQFPSDLNVLRALSRFYARLTTAAAAAQSRRERELEPAPVPGQPDEHGFYRIGGDLPPPRPLEKPPTRFPEEAKAVGLEGLVILEVWINEQGMVVNARVLRGIPMLEEAALAAVRTWRFDPPLVNGRPAPVRLTVTHNFTVK